MPGGSNTPTASGFDYTISLFNIAGASAAVVSSIEAITAAALDVWGQYFNGADGAVIDVAVGIIDTGNPNAIASAGPDSFWSDGTTVNGVDLFEANTIIELREGVDPNGADFDLYITINTAFLLSPQAFLDYTADVVPPGMIDYLSVLVHELGHGFGMTGLEDRDTPGYQLFDRGIGTALPEGSGYDQWVVNIDGLPYFTGPTAMAVYGGPVPLEWAVGVGSDFYHFNVLGDLIDNGSFHLRGALMNPFIINGDRETVGALELAVMRDMGLDVVISEDLMLANPIDFFPTPTMDVARGGSMTGNMASITIELSEIVPSGNYPVSVGYTLIGDNGNEITGRLIFDPAAQTAELVFDASELIDENGRGDLNGRIGVHLFYATQASLDNGPNGSLNEAFYFTSISGHDGDVRTHAVSENAFEARFGGEGLFEGGELVAGSDALAALVGGGSSVGTFDGFIQAEGYDLDLASAFGFDSFAEMLIDSNEALISHRFDGVVDGEHVLVG
jgi:hypothetical protein